MSLRSKLVLAQIPQVVALVLLAFVAQSAIAELGQNSRNILKDNYRSVLAAQRMKEYIERMDSGAMFMVGGERERGLAQMRDYGERFEEELRVQEHNITEDGEAVASSALRLGWLEYEARLQKFAGMTDVTAMHQTYFNTLLPQFETVKDGADGILAINQDAMVRKSDHAQRSAEHISTFLLAVAAAGCLGALLISSALTARMLRPLSVLEQAVRRFGEGDWSVRARLPGGDELTQLADAFNGMAQRLQQYRTSSLGELLEAQQGAQAAIDSLPDAVLMVDPERRITHVNAAAAAWLRVEEGQPLGAPEDADTLQQAMQVAHQHVITGGGSYQPRSMQEAVRLDERHVLVRGTPVLVPQGPITGVTLVLQDVTRQMRVEELRNDWVATVAHEFRTPLTSLRMAIHMCVEEAVGPLTVKQADMLHAARQDCERLQTFVDELLDLSRIQAGHMELHSAATPVSQLVLTAVQSQQHAAELRHVHLRPQVLDDPTVQVDAERWVLALSNLLSNAIRYSPEGADVVVSARQDGEGIRFEVRDTGPGVPAAYQQSIFEKYAQVPGAPAGGAGLGLFIAREIVLAHGGRMGVHSDGVQGSIFWLLLP